MDRFCLYAKKIMTKINIKNFKKTLSKFTTGITVVCARNNDVIYAKTINSFNSLSLNPPLVLFCIGNYSSSINKFRKSSNLSINILSKKQKKLSMQFAKNDPPFSNVDYIEGKNKIPIISGCVSNLECKLIDRIKKGDHEIFICKVTEVYINEKLKPLCYFNSSYF